MALKNPRKIIKITIWFEIKRQKDLIVFALKLGRDVDEDYYA